jgi:single-stranded-DNA-specific exonuclease
MNQKRWIVAPVLTTAQAAALAVYPPIVAQLLHNRHLPDAQAAALFFEGELGQRDDPRLLSGMAAAVDRLHHAIRTGERIVVYGDYDTDGVTATALLVQTLRILGGEVEPYIPLRDEEGYGLNVEALRKLKQEQSAAVVVSVDCGVRSLIEGEAAQELGLDLIITDHHQPGETLPRALAIINPKQPGDEYPDKGLAGVGLAYKLAQGLIRPMNPRPRLQASDVLDLVALGTVADLAPLSGENRMLVRQGLGVINGRLKREGLRALMSVARVKPGGVDASAIGYMLGPRLNAAGRLESALAAYHLLTTGDEAAARDLASQLEQQNRDRQELTRWTQARARDIALTTYGDGALLFAADPDFKPGIVGLAAARLTDEFYRPAVVAAAGPDETKGSARSIPEFHITNALDQVRHLLTRHGGHAAAAGFTTASSNIGELAGRLQGIAQDALGELDLRPTLRVDVDDVPLDDLTPELAAQIQRFEPCGYGNLAPVLASRGVKVSAWRTVGADGKHLKLTITAGRLTQEAIAFGQAQQWANQTPPSLDIAYALEVNEWNGQRRVQLNVKSMQAGGG